jgi:thiol-disulfide isomerase/thioredoxin
MTTTLRLTRLMPALLMGLAALIGVDTRALAAPEMDQPAPPLIATALDGQTFDLAKLRGKVILVNFWATWCAPCRREMPVLDAFYRHYREQGLELIGISVDFARDRAKMRKVLAQSPIRPRWQTTSRSTASGSLKASRSPTWSM